MANELNAALDQVRTMAASISTIRGSTKGQPVGGIPVTPWVAVFLSDGTSRPMTYGSGTGLIEETHNITIRVYWDLKDAEETEKNLEQMWSLVLAKFAGDYDLGSSVTYSDLVSYSTGFQDISGVSYRILDCTLTVAMHTQVFTR